MRSRRNMLARALGAIAVAAVVTTCAAAAASDPITAPDEPEPGSVEKIKLATTDAKYLPASVAYVPYSRTVPSPEKVIGHIAGAPGDLSDTATVIKYFRALDAASDRVQLITVASRRKAGRSSSPSSATAPRSISSRRTAPTPPRLRTRV